MISRRRVKSEPMCEAPVVCLMSGVWFGDSEVLDDSLYDEE